MITRVASSIISYEAIRGKIKTGDVILSGNDKTFISKLIRTVTRTPYSHCGIVFDVDFYGERNLMLAESVAVLDLPDEEYKEVIHGVQLHWLSKRLEFNSQVDKDNMWVLPLKEPLKTCEAEKMISWLRNVHISKVKYDYMTCMGLGLEFITGLNLHLQPDFSRLFCSELIVKALQEAGRISECVNASMQSPGDIPKFDCFEEPIFIC